MALLILRNSATALMALRKPAVSITDSKELRQGNTYDDYINNNAYNGDVINIRDNDKNKRTKEKNMALYSNLLSSPRYFA